MHCPLRQNAFCPQRTFSQTSSRLSVTARGSQVGLNLAMLTPPCIALACTKLTDWLLETDFIGIPMEPWRAEALSILTVGVITTENALARPWHDFYQVRQTFVSFVYANITFMRHVRPLILQRTKNMQSVGTLVVINATGKGALTVIRRSNWSHTQARGGSLTPSDVKGGEGVQACSTLLGHASIRAAPCCADNLPGPHSE